MLYLVLSNGYREVLSALVAMATAVAPSGRGGCLPEFGEDLLERSGGWNGSSHVARLGIRQLTHQPAPWSSLSPYWWGVEITSGKFYKSFFSHFITQSEDIHSWSGQGSVHHVSLDIKWRAIVFMVEQSVCRLSDNWWVLKKRWSVFPKVRDSVYWRRGKKPEILRWISSSVILSVFAGSWTLLKSCQKCVSPDWGTCRVLNVAAGCVLCRYNPVTCV